MNLPECLRYASGDDGTGRKLSLKEQGNPYAVKELVYWLKQNLSNHEIEEFNDTWFDTEDLLASLKDEDLEKCVVDRGIVSDLAHDHLINEEIIDLACTCLSIEQRDFREFLRRKDD